MIPEAPGVNDRRLELSYDHAGRRVEKRVFNWLGPDPDDWAATPPIRRRFIWSGWLMLMELDATKTENVNVSRQYTWGLGLAGQSGGQTSGLSALEAAGGIGGLLAMSALGAGPGGADLNYVYFYDGNGNVGQLIDPLASTAAASIKIKYQYDPYGTRTNGAVGEYDKNPFRFSTKYLDNETGLYYFGYRYYHPKLGRWMSRDPIGERGGFNLYAYVSNRPAIAVDAQGLDIYQAPEPGFVRKACGKCGADITDWFKDEYAAQKKGWDDYKADYEKRTGVGIGWYQYAWWAYHNQYDKFWKDDMWAPHPSGGHHYEFNKDTSCGKPGKCQLGCGMTVTLCGKCVHTSVLGNLMFGLMSHHAQLGLNDVTKYVQEIISEYGTVDPYDAPMYGVGADVYGEYDSFGVGSKFCDALLKAASSHGISLEWTGGEQGLEVYFNKPRTVMGVGDRSSCEPCSEKTKETHHSGSDPVRPWGKVGRGS